MSGCMWDVVGIWGKYVGCVHMWEEVGLLCGDVAPGDVGDVG